ncbi:membrane protein [Mycobacterium phage Hilltopfarm]|nr:membrane protein [Mycobacterium phage Hilltopfarm]
MTRTTAKDRPVIRPPYEHQGWRNPLTPRAKDRLAVVLLLTTCLFLGGVWHYAGSADAAPAAVVTVEVSWTGCADLTAPDAHDRTQVTSAVICTPPAATTYPVANGEMYGAALFSPGELVACRVSVGGQEVAFRAALGAVNCLARM